MSKQSLCRLEKLFTPNFLAAITLLFHLILIGPCFSQTVGEEDSVEAFEPGDFSKSTFLKTADSLMRANPDSAFSYALHHILTAKTNQSKQDEAYGRYQLGKCYFEVGQYNLASDSYTESISIFKSVGDKNGEALVLKSLGYLLFNIENKEEALKYYFQSLSLLNFMESPKDQSELYNRIGVTYAALGYPDSSRRYFDKAIVLGEYLNDSLDIARTFNNLGFSHNILEKHKEAINYLKEALYLKQQIAVGDASLCPTFYNLGEAYLKTGMADSSLFYANKSLEIADRLGLANRRKESHELLKEIYVSLGNFELAFNHQKFYYEISKEILDKKTSILINSLAGKYVLENELTAVGSPAEENGWPSEAYYTGIIAACTVVVLIAVRLFGGKRLGFFDFSYSLCLLIIGFWLASLIKSYLSSAGTANGWLWSISLLVLAAAIVALHKPLKELLQSK
jgi:tetratricopeptide (TPR) repeat protein